MNVFNNIRKRYPRIEENRDMFKLLIILRSENRKNFGKLSIYIFFNIAEYLFFDEYMAEKLYLMKLYKIQSLNEFVNYAESKIKTIKELLSTPIEKLPFVNNIDENGKVKSILLPSRFRRYSKLPDKTNYMNATIVIKRENFFSIINSYFFFRLEYELEEQILYFLIREGRVNLLQRELEQQRQRELEEQRQRKLELQRQRELEEQLNVTNLKIKEKKKFLNYKKKNQIKNHNLIIKGRYRKKKNRKW